MKPQHSEKLGWERKKDIRIRYDAEAAGYDELYSDEQSRKYDLALSHIVSLNVKGRILDSGCGTGIFLERVARSVPQAVGVDFSSKALRNARLRLDGSPNVDLVCADFDFLPFPNGTFEQISMFTALPAPVYWGKTLQEALRALTTSGVMMLSFLKREISNQSIARMLSGSDLAQAELIDNETTSDYIVICKRAQR